MVLFASPYQESVSSTLTPIDSGDMPIARPPIHPGEILADEMKELGITPSELSRQVQVPTNRITQIIHGSFRG